MATTKNDDGTVTVTLDYPITIKDGSKVSELTLRRPTAKLMRALDTEKGAISRTMKLLQAQTGIEMPFLDTLDGADLVELVQAVEGFLEKSQPTGAA